MQKSSRFVLRIFFAIILVLGPEITFFMCVYLFKDVKFPLMLDVYELCTAELQEKMLPIRSKFKEVEDKKLEKQQQKVEPFIFTLHFPKSWFYLDAVNVSPLAGKEARRSQGGEIRALFIPRRYVCSY